MTHSQEVKAIKLTPRTWLKQQLMFTQKSCLCILIAAWFIIVPNWQKCKWSEVAQSCPTLSDPMDCTLPGSSVHGIFQARVLKWAAISFSRGTSRPRDQTQVSCIVGRRFTVWATREAQPETKSTSSTLQVDSLPFEPPGKPKNTGVGSLFLIQGIFPTQGLNQALLHCRWILYQLSYQGSPKICLHYYYYINKLKH